MNLPFPLALGAILALSTPLSAEAAPFTFTSTRASARHPLVLLAPRQVDQATLLVRFDTGAFSDGETPGLTRFAQRALVDASRRTSALALARALFAGAASLKITTGLRSCQFELTAGRADFDRLAALVLPMLLAPDLDARALPDARERARHDQRESLGGDLTGLVARVAIEEPGYRNPVHGTEEGLERIEIAQVREYLAGPLSPANATVVATGGFDPARIRAQLSGLSGGVAPPDRPVDLVTPFSLQVPARSEIYLVGFKAAFARVDDAAVARLAGTLLQERIHRALRSRGLGYSELAGPLHSSWLDLFLVLLPAHDPSDQPLGGYVEDRIGELQGGAFTDEDLARNRAALLAELEATDRDSTALARELADGRGGGWYGPGLVSRLRAIDRAAFVQALPALLDPARTVRILYSPQAAKRGPIPEKFMRRGGA
jgi:predicted Zn-dependent peptidase